MKTIKFVNGLSIALTVVWCVVLPMMCTIELLGIAIDAHVAYAMVIAWLVLAFVIMFLQIYVMQWLEDRHMKEA